MAQIVNFKAEVASARTAWCAVAVEIQALVAAWQSGAISQDRLLHNLRIGEILPSALPNEQECQLIRKDPAPAAAASVMSAAPAATGA